MRKKPQPNGNYKTKSQTRDGKVSRGTPDESYLSAKWKGTLTVFTLPDTGSTRQIW